MVKYGFNNLSEGGFYAITWYTINGALALASIISISLSYRLRPCKHNKVFVLYSVCLLVGSSAAFLYLPMESGVPSPRFNANVWGKAIWIAATNVANCFIAYAYKMSTIQLNALLDKEVHLDKMERIEDVFRAKRYLLYFTIIAVLVSVLFGYMSFLVVFSRYAREAVQSAGWDASNVLQLVLFILWSSSLFRLTCKVSNQPDLMPNKCLFYWHALVGLLCITSSISASIIEQVCVVSQENVPSCINCSDIFFLLALIFQSLGFTLALYLLYPAKQDNPMIQINQSVFVLKGFLNPAALQRAVFAQNRGLSETHKLAINQNVQKLVAFMQNMDTQDSVLSSMVIANPHELAFAGVFQYNTRKKMKNMLQSGRSTVTTSEKDTDFDYKSVNVLEESQSTTAFKQHRQKLYDSEANESTDVGVLTRFRYREGSINSRDSSTKKLSKQKLLDNSQRVPNNADQTETKKPWEFAPSQAEIAKQRAARKQASGRGMLTRHSDEPNQLLRGKDLLLQPIAMATEAPLTNSQKW